MILRTQLDASHAISPVLGDEQMRDVEVDRRLASSGLDGRAENDLRIGFGGGVGVNVGGDAQEWERERERERKRGVLVMRRLWAGEDVGGGGEGAGGGGGVERDYPTKDGAEDVEEGEESVPGVCSLIFYFISFGVMVMSTG